MPKFFEPARLSSHTLKKQERLPSGGETEEASRCAPKRGKLAALLRRFFDAVKLGVPVRSNLIAEPFENPIGIVTRRREIVNGARCVDAKASLLTRLGSRNSLSPTGSTGGAYRLSRMV